MPFRNRSQQLNVHEQHIKHTRCDNTRCPSINTCARFQGHVYEDMVTFFYVVPLKIENGKCNMFIDKTSKEAKEFYPPAK